VTNTERPYDRIRDADPETLTKAERASVIVRRLGVTHTEAREALALCGWIVEAAIGHLRRTSKMR